MDSRTRFRNVMQYSQVDRVPWLEEGLRDDVMDRWQGEGMPLEGPQAVFTYDRRERIEVDWSLREPGRRGVVTADELGAWRRNLERPIGQRLGDGWKERCLRWRQRDHLLELPLHTGLFRTLGVDGWSELEAVMYLLADEPHVAQEFMELQGELGRRVAKEVLSAADVDLVSFSEPIGGNHGPLVSPADFRRFCLRNYAGSLALTKQAAVPAIVFMTYGNARCLLPDVMAAGFNCLWAMETETHAMDYRDLRRQFGKELRLIGGIDLDSLLAGKHAVEQEIREKVPELLNQGGFIPLADGRVRATVSWQAYSYYRNLLEAATLSQY